MKKRIMMNKIQCAFSLTILLIIGAVFCPFNSTYAQKAGVKQPKESVFKYLYQSPAKWSGSKFSEHKSTLERSYINVGVGMEQIWGVSEWLGRKSNGFNSDITFGYWLAPIHGVELKLGYGHLPYTGFNVNSEGTFMHSSEAVDYFSMGLNYVFNFTSYASKLETPKKWELIGVAGINFRKGENVSLGMDAGMRVKYNIYSGLGVFAEPTISIMNNKYYNADANLFGTDFSPSISVGLYVSLVNINRAYVNIKNKTILAAEEGFLCDIAVKTNLLYDITGSMNLGFEFGLGEQTTLGISGSYNPWNIDEATNSKIKHFLVQPEFRYWLKERFNGHFFGAHAHTSYYNVGGDNWFTNMMGGISGTKIKNSRYEGWLVGAGVDYGYLLRISRRWGLEANIGVGYAYLDSEKYENAPCGQFQSKETKHYFGPTQAGLTLIFMIK